jgi:putative phosphoesterase
MKLGVISDTHGHLDPRVLELFEGVDHILHAGDIGYASLILELEQIAPVTAVLGNNDAGLHFNETEVVQLGGHKLLVHHIVSLPRPAEPIARRIAREQPRVVIFGHTHQPHASHLGNILFLNPGYAGKPRFRLERSVALLHVEAAQLRVEFKSL